MSFRYVVLGAGAIGAAIGGRLALSDHDVTLVARGAHLESLRSSSLTLVSSAREDRVHLPAVASVAEAAPAAGDVVILATKSQDTEAAIAGLDALGVAGVAVVSAQNGVANESMVARRGFATYGQCVRLAATHLDPGVVEFRSSRGVLDLGRYPAGSDETAERVAADLRESGFESVAQPAIMRWKYAKLLSNLGGTLDAIAGREARGSELFIRARAEGEVALRAAGIDYATDEELRQRYGQLLTAAERARRPGFGSSWQSLARRTGTVEADWLNGEIVLLGLQHSVPTPVNSALRELANNMARAKAAPGSVALAEVERRVAELEAGVQQSPGTPNPFHRADLAPGGRSLTT